MSMVNEFVLIDLTGEYALVTEKNNDKHILLLDDIDDDEMKKIIKKEGD